MIALSLAIAQLAHAQVNLSFSNVDISQVAKAIGAAADTTIIVDPRVKGQLNLVSDNPVSKERALKTLEAALRMQGFALVQDNGILKVVHMAKLRVRIDTLVDPQTRRLVERDDRHPDTHGQIEHLADLEGMNTT